MALGEGTVVALPPTQGESYLALPNVRAQALLDVLGIDAKLMGQLVSTIAADECLAEVLVTPRLGC